MTLDRIPEIEREKGKKLVRMFHPDLHEQDPEKRKSYEHLQARILELIETLDELRASAEMEIIREVEQDEEVIDRIAAAQREELEQEIADLEKETERIAEEAWELAGEVPF